MIYLSLKFL